MIQLTVNILGVFAIKNGRIVERALFPKDPKAIAEKLRASEDAICDEERQILEKIKGARNVGVDRPERFRGKGFDTVLEFVEDDELKPDLMETARELGLKEDEVRDILYQVNLELTKLKLKVVEKDQLIIQAMCSLDDIDEAANKLIERLREWYSLHYPELDYIVKNHELYVKLAHDLTLRRNYHKENLNFDPDFAGKIEDSAKDSFGVEFSEKDAEAIKALSKPILELHENRKKIEAYIEGQMKENAPNINALIGPILGARFIALAGSLNRLVMMPAGTIQVLGAEDAFFRFLKTRKNPPKHGLIFQAPEVRGAQKKNRGRIARTLAAKIALASKADYFKGEFIGDRLRRDFMKRVEGMQ